MTFLRTIPPAAAEGPVKEMYDRVRAEHGHIPNWAEAFSLRPAVREGWAGLIGSIRSNLSLRRYELVTLAAARALRSSYCSLVHGHVLATKVLDAETVQAIMQGEDSPLLEPAEVAMMHFVEKIVRHADHVTENDIADLRANGFTDEDIFDIAAAAAARCFFSKLLDSLGVEADASYNDIDPALRVALTVGRSIARPQS